jgi:ATP-dependent Lhr-like helicase
MTPDGEMIGKLDARFVNSKDSEEISLGGRNWSMVKCDEGHNIVVVVPSGSDTSRIFWTSSGESGFSPLVCRMVQRICSCGGSALELPEHEHEVIQPVLQKTPAGFGKKGLHIIERKGSKGKEVLVYSFSGSMFNGLLCVLLQDRIGGRVQVKYNDFIIRVYRAGKDGLRECVMHALKEIQNMGKDEIRKVLPVPRSDEWKFSRALPSNLLSDLSLSDHYHVEEFMKRIKSEQFIALNSDQ